MCIEDELNEANKTILMLNKIIEDTSREKEILKQEFSQLSKVRDKLIKENDKLKNAIISKFLNIDFNEDI